MAEVLFHGAAGEVTGSLHLVQAGGQWIALDCGMFHGRRDETEAKNRAWPVPPQELAAVVISHAHIDHTGRLPRLVRDGFEGPIYCTAATRDLCAVMLPDSAHIQEEDVAYVNKKRRKQGLGPIEALYTSRDALNTIRRIHAVPYDRWFTVTDGVRARYHEAGHMLGSAGIELKLSDGGDEKTLYFTGDLGRREKPILRDPAALPPCDLVISESTYGGRQHEPVDDAKAVLTDVVNRTVARGGKLIIPAFSVGRTQTIVYFLHEQMTAGKIPTFPVYVDSPLSVNATEVFRLHPECYDEEALAFQADAGDILGGRMITYIRHVEESKALHRRRRPCAIISASGMCEFGRIRHHIKNNIRSSKNTILIPGFQAAHTLGRRLVDGAAEINLFHKKYRVRAEVVSLAGFSGHADQDELVAALAPLRAQAAVYLVHGEPDQQTPLAERLRGEGFRRVELATPGLRVAV